MNKPKINANVLFCANLCPLTYVTVGFKSFAAANPTSPAVAEIKAAIDAANDDNCHVVEVEPNGVKVELRDSDDKHLKTVFVHLDNRPAVRRDEEGYCIPGNPVTLPA